MPELTTIASITEYLTKQVQTSQPISPDTWLEAAQHINVLLQKEQETLYEMEQKVAVERNILLEAGENVSKAKAKIEATDDYKNARIQKAKIERALELIRIAKHQARMGSDLFKASP